ncbi:hypothetical protein G6F31_016400 [Rhizopus arrhizus]|nr:hypothetical protein G6F31_016400 [Rhizopus arrhizus]
MVSRALKAAEEAGVDAEVIDLRTLDRASLDWDTIGASIQKTNNVLIVEQGARGTSYGAMLSDEIQRRYFDWLDQPIKRVTGGEASPSISKVLERAAFADTEEVLAGLAAVLAVLGLLVPPLVACKGFPTRNAVKVTPDGLEFSRRGPLAFADLKSWGTDDYLKLIRPGLPTVLVSPVDLPSRERLLRDFEQALQAWQKRQPAGTAAARRTHFYGSTAGRLVGLLITALGAGSAVMALSQREPSISLAIVGGLGALFGLAMLFGKRG